jgi:hypothetical protein
VRGAISNGRPYCDSYRDLALTGPSCSLGAEAINCIFKLTVPAGPSLLSIKFNRFVWLDGCPFKNRALPCVLRSGWQCQSEFLADLYRSGGKETTGSLLANNPGQIVLSRKCNDHFSCTRGMTVLP